LYGSYIIPSLGELRELAPDLEVQGTRILGSIVSFKTDSREPLRRILKYLSRPKSMPIPSDYFEARWGDSYCDPCKSLGYEAKLTPERIIVSYTGKSSSDVDFEQRITEPEMVPRLIALAKSDATITYRFTSRKK
jgi:hypothetical protein